MSTLAYILSTFQECDITGGDINEVNQYHHPPMDGSINLVHVMDSSILQVLHSLMQQEDMILYLIIQAFCI
jgi:hypothetical protein